jgi:tRNA-splicing ligase RtcB (3'-phosphate/5'-hydroxy nucleic acid ligase)
MTTSKSGATVRQWLVEPLAVDVAQSLDRLAHAEDVCHVAVMPDVHLSGEVCVGVAVATRNLLYPAAVGSDIGCGMAAVRFAANAELLADENAAARLLSGLYRRVPSLKHSRESAPAALPEELQQTPLNDPRLDKLKSRDGRIQFGTLGRGNHFLEFQADQEDRLWLMVHSGSRAMGQAITLHHCHNQAASGRSQRPAGLDANGSAGQAYLADADWAIGYAEQNRLAMIDAVGTLLKELFGVSVEWETLIHANHNHVRRETHLGESFWVHRKGSLAAAEGQSGVIPGSMGTASFHVVGRGHAPALGSSSHGAGRALSRGEACRAISPRRLERELQGVWFDHRKLAKLCDEAPSAYKDIYAVMRAQRDLTRIERELRPLLSYKGT